jgi:hypothetical protein
VIFDFFCLPRRKNFKIESAPCAARAGGGSHIYYDDGAQRAELHASVT